MNMIFFKRKRRIIAASVIVLLILIATFAVPARIIPRSSSYSYAMYDRNGTLIGAQVATDGQWRLSPDNVPQKFRKAVIAYEDKRFYVHFGIDVISIARAIRQNLTKKKIVSGGSTITMQTVRILEKNPPRTYRQKLHEALIAVLFEIRFTKKHILELYCANAPFGGNVVGLEAASWRYFNRKPSDLTWAEAATLAVLPNQPSLVYPGANSDILLEKRNILLARLYKKHCLDKKTFELSLAEPLPKKPYPFPQIAPHYLEFLKKTSKKHQTKFNTTLDANIQANARRILEQCSLSFSKKGIDNASLLILNTQTLEVLAYYANTGAEGRNKNSYAVDLIQSARSSGSLLKPFLYAAMLDSGELLPDQLVIDVPTRIGNYRPDNNIPVYTGVIPASEALTRSLNIPAIRELREFGINRFLDYLKSCGFTTFNRSADDYGLPLILGGGEITLWEATRAYAQLMNRANSKQCDFPASVGSAWLTVSALSEGNRPDDEANWQSYARSKRIAWKTGTSSGNRDAWAIGTTAEYTVGVWIGNSVGTGNPDLKSVSTSAPVLFEMFGSLPPTSWPQIPYDALRYEQICTNSGYIAGANCKKSNKTFVPKAAQTGRLCPYCTKISLTPDGLYQATAQDLTGEQAGAYNGTVPRVESRFVLPPNLEYWYRRTNLSYRSLPDFVPWHNAQDKNTLSIVFPEPNAKIIIPTEIDGTPGALVMQAANRFENATLYWDVDGDYLGQTTRFHQMQIFAKPGTHTLTITDSNGNRAKRNFEVVESE